MNEPRRRFHFKMVTTIFVTLTLIAVTTLKVAQARTLRMEATRRKAQVEAGPRVRVAIAGSDDGNRSLTIQGEALPYASTTLYAKVSGFLKEIRVDKGSRVQQGQLLAVIESSEVDEDTLALRADAENKQRDAERAQQLGHQGILSAHDVDAADSAARIAQEKLASQSSVQGYKNVVAPFSGTVTERYVDRGALIQNGGNSNAAQPIVSVATVDRLRVTFYLDQVTATLVRTGLEVKIRPADRPDQIRTATITRLSGALDLRTRTMLAEAELDNKDGLFLAGEYVQVSLKLPDSKDRLEIPPEAILTKGEKSFAAVVEGDSRIRLRTLVLGEDNGGRVRVLQGLRPGERIVLNPASTMKDGDRVQVADAKS